MHVHDWMTKDVVTISGASSLREAIELIRAREIRHLPVVDGGRLIGIVTDRDIRKAIAPEPLLLDVHEADYLLDKVYVRDIMTRQVVGVSPDVSFAKAAELMVRNKIGCLPVLEGEMVVGIITESDILRAVAEEERGAVGQKVPHSRGKE